VLADILWWGGTIILVPLAAYVAWSRPYTTRQERRMAALALLGMLLWLWSLIT